ncbi:MAG: transglycosylase domain-containing protein [Prevotella sp.]|nr:transglycosylase domain-containing protein [Prevotella sp.]MCM1074847.1 transglycosylase domain-containing protein [Ruminococcus sp.]
MNLKNFPPKYQPNNKKGKRPLTREEKKSLRTRRIVKWLWISFLSVGFIGFLFLLLIYNGIIGYMPPIDELEDPHDNFASVLYACDGQTEIGRFYEVSANRENVEFKEISPYVIDALLATEDSRFMRHSGIDFRALGRTGVKTLLMGDKSSGGASTITQQLAKILYTKKALRGWKRMLQKPIEWMIAIKLERVYTKEELIKMYLNRFDFLNNAIGIKTAAAVYFNKLPNQLNIQESAMLIGMLKNPSYYNPLTQPERTLGRRNTVLAQMEKAGLLTQFELDSISQLPLGLDYHKVTRTEGTDSYLREQVRRLMTAQKPVRPVRGDYKTENAYKLAMSKYNTDSVNWSEDPLYGWILKNPKPDGEYYDLDNDGLRIYTTIDMRMQKYAEEAMYEHLGGVLQPAFVREKGSNPYTKNTAELSASGRAKLIDQGKKQTERYRIMKSAGKSEAEIDKAFSTPRKMKVFAYVKEHGKLKSGSKEVTMSPLDSMLYMKSILRMGMVSMDPQNGYVKAYIGGPDFNFFQYDMAGLGRRQIGSTVKPFLYALAMEQDYTPCSTMLNSRPTYGGWSPRSSTGGRAGQMVTLKWALTNSNNWISARLIADLLPQNLANKMRLFGITGHLDATMPLCLGPNDVSVMELVGAYTAFANNGIRTTPILVSRIEDQKGNVIFNAVPHRTEVMAQSAVCNMLDMMMSVVDHGTARSLRAMGLTAQMAGKTGTTNYNADMWFVGFVPNLVTGVWIGGEERYIHFDNMAYGQGAKAALPIYGIYMQKLYADKELPYNQDEKFSFPTDYRPCDYVAPRAHRASAVADAPSTDVPAEEVIVTALE